MGVIPDNVIKKKKRFGDGGWMDVIIRKAVGQQKVDAMYRNMCSLKC